MTEGQIADNIGRIRDRMAQAAKRAGRSADTITLLAVTKTVEPKRILEAYAAGICEFGENYLQEAVAKQNDDLLKRLDVRWHFIGHLQSNKVKEVAGRFALIQSVDSLSLAREIGRRAQRSGQTSEILLEVKLDSSEAKFGFRPEDALDAAAQAQNIPGIQLSGFMGMAPFSPDPENARPYFRRLRTLFERLPPEVCKTLSMGMTGDFEVAIEEGATLIRIGTAIFGTRPIRE
jgi:pyridoxal phosphate enzyme (YggS family)